MTLIRGDIRLVRGVLGGLNPRGNLLCVEVITVYRWVRGNIHCVRRLLEWGEYLLCAEVITDYRCVRGVGPNRDKEEKKIYDRIWKEHDE